MTNATLKTIILKNTTLSDISIAGVLIPASGQEDFSSIPVSDLFDDPILTTLIIAGDIVVNNGTSDLTNTGGEVHVSRDTQHEPWVMPWTDVDGQLWDDPLPQQHFVLISEGPTVDPVWGWPRIRVMEDGSPAPGMPYDTFNFTGNVTITNPAGRTGLITIDYQNHWETIDADTGSDIALTPTDTLTVSGGAGISTNITGGILTITNDSPNADQNLWETVTSDSGSTSADITTDTLTVAGGVNISTTVSGDTLTIDATGAAAFQIVTTYAGLPGSPSTNDLVFYTPFNAVLQFDGSDWVGPKETVPLFGQDGSASDKWIDGIASSEAYPHDTGITHGYPVPNITAGSGGGSGWKLYHLSSTSSDLFTGSVEIHKNSTVTGTPVYGTSGIMKVDFTNVRQEQFDSTAGVLVSGNEILQCFVRKTGGDAKDLTLLVTYSIVAEA